jgi:hypothetical protein
VEDDVSHSATELRSFVRREPLPGEGRLSVLVHYFFFALVALTAVGCDEGIPADSEGTLARARARGTLRVGVTGTNVEIGAAEKRLVEEVASSFGLGVEWSTGSASSLLADLEEYRLDVVAAELDAKDPWSRRVGFSRPWRVEPDGTKRVLAVAPGENALLTSVDRICLAEKRR